MRAGLALVRMLRVACGRETDEPDEHRRPECRIIVACLRALTRMCTWECWHRRQGVARAAADTLCGAARACARSICGASLRR